MIVETGRGRCGFVASLPMYDLAELSSATNLWLDSIVACALEEFGFPPEIGLAENGLPEDCPPHERHWRAGRALLLSQACGLPLVSDFADELRVVGVPHYECEGCGADGSYCSFIIATADADDSKNKRRTRAAINSCCSLSGALLLAAAMKSPLEDAFEEVVVTGSHSESIVAVASRRADVAAIDCVTWALLARERPGALAGVRVVGRTPSAPALPLVTWRGHSADTLLGIRHAVATALADPKTARARSRLLLRNIDLGDAGGSSTLEQRYEARIAELRAMCR